MSNPSDFNRRRFLLATLSGSAASQVTAAAAPAASASELFHEPSRDVPLAQDADVIVCGAGPAGVAAAITAARAGAQVRLFEWRGCLGGIWTAGLLGYFLDFDKPGFAKELRDELDKRGARADSSSASRFCYDPEALKLLLEEWCVAAGVKFQFHTRVSAAFKEGNRLTTIVTESKSGRQAWRAPIFIDTTGDGDLGFQAGCAFEIGMAADCPCQPMSLNALLMVKDAEALREFIRFGQRKEGENTDSEKKQRIKEVLVGTGHFPSYAGPTMWHVSGNLVFAMMNHEYGIKPWDAAEVTAATVRARAEMNKMVAGLRALGGPWEGLQIVATAEQIGVRDGRRIKGRYTVLQDDLAVGARHEDAVVRVKFGIDVHALSADDNQKHAIMPKEIKMKPYDIPLRALIAKDVDGLMMAGRCISGDFIAHSSYRVTGNAVAMGEAAGVVAALAAKTGRLPQNVSWQEGEAKLAEIGLRG
jgi:hypothetical protein